MSCFFIARRTARVSGRARRGCLYVQRLIPFSAPVGWSTNLGLSPSLSPFREGPALSYFRVRTLRYVSRLIYGRSINTNVHTGAACANQWRDTTCTRVWCLRGREDAWIYTTCLPLKSFGGGIRRFNNSRCLFSYGYDARLGANFEIEKVFILCLSLSFSLTGVILIHRKR